MFSIKAIDILVAAGRIDEAKKALGECTSGHGYMYKALIALAERDLVGAVVNMRKSALKNPYLMNECLQNQNGYYWPHVAERFEDSSEGTDVMYELLLLQWDGVAYNLLAHTLASAASLAERAKWAKLAEEYVEAESSHTRIVLWEQMLALVDAVDNKSSELILKRFAEMENALDNPCIYSMD